MSTMSPHSSQVGSQVISFTFEFMAVCAILAEKFFAGFDISRFFHCSCKLLNQGILFLLLRPANFVENLAGKCRHFPIRMSPQTMNRGWTEIHQIYFFSTDRFEQGSDP